MTEWLRRMPKIDLHVHLDGSLRLKTVLAFARALPPERALPDGVDLKRAVLPESRGSLEDYLVAFDYTVPLLQTPAALERAAYELCEDAASENVVYMEIRFAPLLHTRADLKPRDVVAAVLAGMHRAETRFGIATGLILTALKQDTTEQSIETVQLAAQFRRDGVVGIDLAGPEHLNPPLKHRKAIEFAHDAGLHITIHAGEGCCPEQIKEALDLGAERIGHGVYLIQAPRTEKRVAELGIPLEMCPTSNLQIAAFIKTYADHPIKRYLDAGIVVTVNTDNRLMSQTDMTSEFEHLVKAFKLTRKDVRRLVSNSVRAAFTTDERKRELQSKVDAFFAPTKKHSA
ncbi:MAG: adenosine deaminase [Candidatus Bipolaricaulis sp.]|nr:adenosine deaminase [Candidatus Bipolaricaulis sp.]